MQHLQVMADRGLGQVECSGQSWEIYTVTGRQPDLLRRSRERPRVLRQRRQRERGRGRFREVLLAACPARVPGCPRPGSGHADYLNGVVVTLAWVCGERAETPITKLQPREVTANVRTLKGERVYAKDVIEQSGELWASDWFPPRWYAEGVGTTITWLLSPKFGLVTPPGHQCLGVDLRGVLPIALIGVRASASGSIRPTTR